MKLWAVFFFLCSTLWLLGCQTVGVVVEESNYSVKQHREAIAQVMFLVGQVSDNGRVVTSQYHDRNFKYFQVTGKTKERLYTRATILGARRPYRFTVEVRIERRDPQTGRFTDLGLDDNLSRRQAIAIKNALTQSRENGGVFDEEAPF